MKSFFNLCEAASADESSKKSAKELWDQQRKKEAAERESEKQKARNAHELWDQQRKKEAAERESEKQKARNAYLSKADGEHQRAEHEPQSAAKPDEDLPFVYAADRIPNGYDRFYFKAINPNGELKTGLIDARDIYHAISRLTAMNWTIDPKNIHPATDQELWDQQHKDLWKKFDRHKREPHSGSGDYRW